MRLAAVIVALIALAGAIAGPAAAPTHAQTPTVTANGPWIEGANSAVVQSNADPSSVAIQIEQVSGGFEVTAIWFLVSGRWDYFLPDFPAISTLTQLPSPAAIIAILNRTSSSGFGSISGRLSYPSEAIPPLRVVAIEEDGSFLYVDTVLDQTTYTIPNVPVGRYRVLAYRSENFAGAYTRAVLCGLTISCVDHSLIVVEVGAGQHVTGIDPADWQQPGTFPPDPT